MRFEGRGVPNRPLCPNREGLVRRYWTARRRQVGKVNIVAGALVDGHQVKPPNVETHVNARAVK